MKDRKEYNKKYYADNKGLEGKCSGKNCGYCSKRPEKHKSHDWVFINKKKGVCK